jgi:Cytochrome c2
LAPEQANKAGPTLAGIFGRRIATCRAIIFSEGLKRLDIVWTPETVSKLFEIGPSAYTPGTKMPEQRIGSEQDRAALVQFLARDQEVARSSPLLLRIGKEQLLAIDLVAGDRGLAFRRDQPIDKRLAELFLHGGIFFRVYQHDAVLIEQPLVAFDHDLEDRRGS